MLDELIKKLEEINESIKLSNLLIINKLEDIFLLFPNKNTLNKNDITDKMLNNIIELSNLIMNLKIYNDFIKKAII